MQSNNPSPQSNAPEKVQHDDEELFILVEGLGKFCLTAAVQDSRKANPIPPVSTPSSPIATLPIAVPETALNSPTEPPVEVPKPAVKPKLKKTTKSALMIHRLCG